VQLMPRDPDWRCRNSEVSGHLLRQASICAMLVPQLVPVKFVMRKIKTSHPTIRALLVANGCVALITSSAALVVMLIAPLGLAAVITCTLLVAVLCFSAGLVADVLLWRLFQANRAVPGLDEPRGSILAGARLPFLDRPQGRLPHRRP
jgi:hypothetical protein